MNELEKLNERIEQLTELVKTGSEAIKSMETALKAAEEERDRLADQRKETEPKFERVEGGDMYYSIGSCWANQGYLNPFMFREVYSTDDNERYKNNNYFHTEKRAEEIADKIRLLLRLERLYDIYCPEYMSDWSNDNEWKYRVYFNSRSKRYCYNGTLCGKHICEVYFPTGEVAKKVCDILNAELEGKGSKS